MTEDDLRDLLGKALFDSHCGWDEEYDNLLSELASALDDLSEDDSYMSVSDFRRRIEPWLPEAPRLPSLLAVCW